MFHSYSHASRRGRSNLAVIVTVLTAVGMLVGPAIGQTIVTAGDDGWRTPEGGTSFDFSASPAPVPADFFGPGSDPFDGAIFLRGGALETPGDPGALDPVDTIVRRTEDTTDLDSGPSTITIELIALSLVSINPITVTYNGGQDPELWDVSACLSDTAPGLTGTMTITKTSSDGGTFDAQDITILPKFMFTRQSDSALAVLDCGSNPGICGTGLVLNNPNGVWALVGGPSNIQREDWGIPDLPADVAIDANCDGDTLDSVDVVTIGHSNFLGGVKIAGIGRNMQAYCERMAYAEEMLAAGVGGHESFLASADDSDGDGTPDQCEEGACCDPAGGCTMKTPKECVPPQSFQGLKTVCTATEACCFKDDTCEDLDPLCCKDQGGTRRGPGTSCLGDVALPLDGFDDACVPPIDPSGACCVKPGKCSQVAGQAACDAIGGSYQGDGTSCSDADICPIIPAATEWGVVVMVLLVLAAGTIVIRKRRAMRGAV